MMAWNKLYKRLFLKDKGLMFMEGIIHEDVLWNFQTSCLAQSIHIVNIETYIYRVRTGSITSNLSLRGDFSTYTTILIEMTRFAKVKGLLDKGVVYNIIQDFWYSIYVKMIPFRDLFLEFYSLQKKQMEFKWTNAVVINKFSVKNQIRDSHLLWPPQLAYYWIKTITAMVKWYKGNI